MFLSVMENNCDPNPCKGDGTCQDGLDGFQCICPLGLTGERCEVGL